MTALEKYEDPEYTPTPAEKIVFDILNDMSGRRGMGLDEIDTDTQSEIIQEWIDIVNKNLESNG